MIAKEETRGSLQDLCSTIHVSVPQSSGAKYGNPRSGSRACGADLVKQYYNFKSVGQRSGSRVKVG